MASVLATNPLSWNRYSYVLNKPLNLIDPSGLSARSSDGGCSAEFSNCDENEGGSRAESDYEGRLDHQARLIKFLPRNPFSGSLNDHETQVRLEPRRQFAEGVALLTRLSGPELRRWPGVAQ